MDIRGQDQNLICYQDLKPSSGSLISIPIPKCTRYLIIWMQSHLCRIILGVSKKIPDPPNEDKRRVGGWQDDVRLEQEYQTSWQSISGHAGLSICKAERAQPPDLICRQHRPHNSATTIFWEETLLTRLHSSSVANMDFLHHVQSDLVIPLCYILGVIHGVANSKDLA